MKRTFLKSLAATALLANLPFVASAQGTRTVAQIASHEGADRHNMLLEGAKKEGELLVYYSHPIVQVMLDAFNKKYDALGKGLNLLDLVKSRQLFNHYTIILW